MTRKIALLKMLAPAAVGVLALAGGADAVAPAGSKVYVVNPDGDSVSVVSVAPYELMKTIPVGDLPQGAAISPLGDRLYVASSGDEMSISVIDTATDTVIGPPIVVSGFLFKLAISPDGSTLYAPLYRAVSVISTASGSETARIQFPASGSGPQTVVVHPSGAKLYAFEEVPGIYPVPTDTNIPGAPIAVSGNLYPSAAAFYANGTRLLVVGSGSPAVIDTTTDTVIPNSLADLGSQASVAVAGTRAVVGNVYNPTVGGGSVDVYNLATSPPTFVGSFNAGGLVTGVEIAPDGSAAWAHCINTDGHGDVTTAPWYVLVQFDPRNPAAAGTIADVGAGGDGPGPVVGLFPGGGGPAPDDPPEEAYIRPDSVTVKVNSERPEKSSVVIAGVLDSGPHAPDFTGPATLDVGGLHEMITALVPKGKALTHKKEGFNLSITPNAAGSSGARFSLTYKGDISGKVGLEGKLALRFQNAAFDAGAEATVKGGRFRLVQPAGSLAEPDLFVVRAQAVVKDGAKDTLALTAGLAGGGAVPAEASDLTIGFGGAFSVTIPKSEFERRGAKDVFSGEFGGIRKATVDHARRTITISGKSLELGAFALGGNSVVVTIGLAGESHAVAVRMALTGKTLKY